MAYVPPDEQITPAPPDKQQAQNAPVAAGGSGVAGTSKASAATAGQNVPAQPSAQLSAYLGANQPQTQALAGNVAQTVGGQVQDAGNAIQPAVNAYTGNIYSVPTDTAVNQTVETAPSTLTPAEQATYKAELGAAQNVPNSANTFETTKPYQDVTQGIQKAVGQANLWNQGNNVPALQTALAPFESQAATQGDRTLDALLLSQSPGAYSQIQNAVAPAANLQGQLDTGTQQANAALQSAIAQNQAVTPIAQGAAQTYATNLAQYLKSAIDEATAGDKTQSAKILSDLAANTPSEDDMAILGVTPDQWTALSSKIQESASFGTPVTLSNYLTQTDPNITPAQAATPTQYSDVAMLQSLLGANAPVMPIDQATADQSGKLPSLASLDKFDFPGAQKAAQEVPSLEAAGQKIKDTQNYYIQQYLYDGTHFGGQTQSQMNYMLTDLSNQLAQINAKIAAKGGKPIAPNTTDSVPASDQLDQFGIGG